MSADAPHDPIQRAESTPPGEETARAERRRGPGRIDLSSIIAEVDKEASAVPAKRRGDARQRMGSFLDPGQPAESQGRPGCERKAAGSLADVFAVGGPAITGQAPQAGAESGESGRLKLPAGLEQYLPAELWRRLNGTDPERRVLITALDRVRSVLYQVATFLPRHLVEEKKRQPFPGRVKGQMQRGALLFSDVSGFTALSERLAALGPEGAELLTARMNEYFGVMLDILAESDGILLKFAGDALLAYFPSAEDDLAPVVSAAVRAGQRMLQAMSRFAQIRTPNGEVRLKMKLGLAAGDFLAASLGTDRRMEYIVIGQAISETMAAEGLTTAGGQMVLNPQAAAALQAATPHAPHPHMKRLKHGFYLLESGPQVLDDFEIRADNRRARSGIPLNAGPQAIVTQMEVALRQIQALVPYLAPELAERVLAPTGRRGLVSQFRPTTVIFCNFSGPEQLLQIWGEAGVQRVTSLLSAYFCAMNEVIARYGGIVSRIDPYSKGTKLLALFGAPVAHEDDAQRAVSATLAMNMELELLNEAWQKKFARHLPPDWSQPLIQQRIGITYGQTFAGQVGASTRREYTVMGDEVNLAARLMGAAELGRILVSQPVKELTGETFLFTQRPPIRVKGKSLPIQVSQVEGIQEDTLLRRIHGRGKLVGRNVELGPWIEALRGCQQGRGSTLIIQGPAGVGKSHLADEMIKRAENQGAQVLAVRCLSYNKEVPLSGWGQLFRLLAGINSLDYTIQMQEEKFRRLLARLGTRPGTAPLLASLSGFERSAFEPPAPGPVAAATPGTDDLAALAKTSRRRRSKLDTLDLLTQPGARAAPTGLDSGSHLSSRERDQLHEAVWTALVTLTQANPVVVFFEDAHTMDLESLDLLQFINRQIHTLPLLILLARRSEDVKDAGKLGRILSLKPLAQQGTYDLVAHLVVAELAQVIYDQTQGNPLQVNEITQWFMRTYRIQAGEVKRVLQTSDFLQKMVLSRVEEMPEIRREIVRAAAVIGKEFRASEVQALLSSTMDAVTLNQHLRALPGDLVRSAVARVDPSYTFQQSLVRDILYNSLPHEQRRALHARFAEYLSKPTRAQDRARAWLADIADTEQALAQSAERIAYHYEQAAQWLPAARCWLSVAQQAQENQRYDRAGHAYRQVLENLSQLSNPGRPSALDQPASETGSEQARRLQYQAQVGLGDAAFLAGDFVNLLPAYEAAAACEAAGEAGLPLKLRLALALAIQGKMAEALASLPDSAGRPESCADLATSALIAWIMWRLDKREARKWARRAQVLAGLKGESLYPQVIALLEEITGDWNLAVVDYYQQNCWLGAGLALLRQGQKQRLNEHLPAARKVFQQAAAHWQAAPQGNNPHSLALYLLAEVAWLQKDVPAARQTLEQAHVGVVNCPPSLQANGQAAIQRALKMVEKGSTRRWPAWDWQAFDNQARATILFQSLLAGRNGRARDLA